MVKTMGLVTEADRAAWFNLCQRWHRIRQLENEIDEHGHVVSGRQGELKRNPAASMLKAELEHFRRERGQFGLDPKSREMLGVKLPAGPPSRMAELCDW
jgi:P27 family predicted phage terminase small subunit